MRDVATLHSTSLSKKWELKNVKLIVHDYLAYTCFPYLCPKTEQTLFELYFSATQIPAFNLLSWWQIFHYFVKVSEQVQFSLIFLKSFRYSWCIFFLVFHVFVDVCWVLTSLAVIISSTLLVYDYICPLKLSNRPWQM